MGTVNRRCYFHIAVSSIIKETCPAIWQVLNEKYLIGPKLPEDWENIPEQFMQLWNFPDCIGTIDGKHIAIECPINSGSLYHNYKGFFQHRFIGYL